MINAKNVNRIRAKLVAEAANIPATYEMERRLNERGVLVIPDIIANAGGVISSYSEYIGENVHIMFQTIEERIVRNVRRTLEKAVEERTLPRDAALKIAQERVKEAMETRKG